MPRTAVGKARAAVAAPFLKWAGGKRQLLPEIRKHVPAKFGRYFEPFVGGGAVFFDLAASGRILESASLGDGNVELMTTYRSVRDDVESVISILREHKRRHSRAHYYEVRRERRPDSAAAAAARMIYLNKTGFNGLYRVNRAGEFNVPMGSYDNPTVCDEANLRACSAVMRRASVDARDFEAAFEHACAGDFVYCDPPYVPVSETANFTDYTVGGFTMEDQRRLAHAARDLKARGVCVLLSNVDLPVVRDLYKDFEVRSVSAKRAINSRTEQRGVVGELLIS